jgi:uncharacterized Zn finger protein (UPF0148 family)
VTDKHCLNCGKPVRSLGAHYCAECFTGKRKEQRARENTINRARNAAINRLRDKFKEEWDVIYAEEKEKLGV